MRSALLLLFVLIGAAVKAQKNGGVEQSFYMQQNSGSVAVPMIWYQTKHGWYSALRYNYEDVKTVSLFLGKNFSGTSGNSSITATPMAGILWGATKGTAAAVKFGIETNSFYFASEPQYVFSFNGAQQNFFYNWSEAGIAALPFLYTGIALQHTKVPALKHQWEAGAVAGFLFKNIELPVYLFNAFGKNKYLVVGFNWELNKE